MEANHLFFDFDHTLWDHDRNSHETLVEFYHEYSLVDKGVESPESFTEVYREFNSKLWEAFNRHEIDKEKLREIRFFTVLEEFGISDRSLADRLEHNYLESCSRKKSVMPGAEELLDYLEDKYSLHLITNGFSETQRNKIRASGLGHYFDCVVIADDIKINKPDPRIFYHALELAGAHKDESVYIGDNPTADVQGARSAGLRQVHFNPNGEFHNAGATLEISSLLELKDIF